MSHGRHAYNRAKRRGGFDRFRRFVTGAESERLWNVRDALRVLQPRFACLENVAAMVSAKFKPMFDLWRQTTEDLGYASFAQRLNAKHYGVPQNRDRIFLFSVHKAKNGGEARYVWRTFGEDGECGKCNPAQRSRSLTTSSRRSSRPSRTRCSCSPPTTRCSSETA